MAWVDFLSRFIDKNECEKIISVYKQIINLLLKNRMNKKKYAKRMEKETPHITTISYYYYTQCEVLLFGGVHKA